MNPSFSTELLYFSGILSDLIFSKSLLDDCIDYLGDDSIEKLLSLYKEPLKVKNIHTKKNLIKIMRIDFEKIVYALLETINKSGFQVLNDFFDDDMETADILTKSEGKQIYHIGFEVNEPISLFLYGLNYWFKKFNQTFGENMKVIKFIRFPASQAFQDRVKANVEIMRIWIQVRNHEIMLELFDIHHIIKHDMEVRASHADPDEKASLFTQDSIWHYALYVDHAAKVRKLHDDFIELTQKKHSYKLPFATIVNNKHDGSFYTKIINQKKSMELEFVTEINSSMTVC